MRTRITLAALVAAVAVVCPAQATVPTTANSVTYIGNGGTVAYPTTFPFQRATDLTVTVAGAIVSNYTVTGAGNATGTVTFTTAPANLASVVIIRTVDYKQGTSFKQQSIPSPAAVEAALDRLAMGEQQLAAQVAAPVLPSTLTNATSVTATGSTTAIQLQDWFATVVNIKAFGGVADGATDVGPAIQRAHDALSGNGGAIYFPPAGTNYNIATTVVFTKPIRLVGAGWAGSTIASQTNGLTWFTTTNQIQVESMAFTAFGGALNTAVFVKQLSGSSGHNGTLFHNDYFQGANKAYWAQRANEFRVDKIKCNNGAYCLYLENLTSSDEGDSFVSNSEFANSTSAIFVASTSGLYIAHNKFNGAASCHIDLAPNGGGGGTNAIGDFTITGNSIEGQTTCGVRMAGSFTNTKVLVTGNQFSSGGATHVIVGNNAQNVTITGNTFNDSNAAAGLGIDLQAGAKNVTITGNAFHQILQAMQATTTVLGVDTSGNRFASDVTTYWTGEDSNSGQTAFGGSKMLGASREVTNNTPATYTDVFKVKGQCVLEIELNGLVQGVGTASQYLKVLIDGSTPTITNIVAPVTSGAQFDLQVAASGGYAVVSVRQHTAVGTGISMVVTVRVTGYPTGFLHA